MSQLELIGYVVGALVVLWFFLFKVFPPKSGGR